MELTMSSAIWQVLIDTSIMGVLLLVGEILRARVKIFQKVLVPPAVIAGFLALFLGPKSPIEVMRILPLSASFGTYASVLIVVIFAATPIGDKPEKDAVSVSKISGMFFNITGIAVLQYAVGMLATLLFLTKLYPELDENFGLMMATGFYGGHGTAAAVGKALEDLGVANMTDLGNTCATIGIVGGIITGMIVINWGTRRGYTHYVESPKSLPMEMLTGLVAPEKQKSSSKDTVASICLDPLGFHLGIVLLASLIGYLAAKWFAAFTLNNFNYKVSIPEFCLSLIAGLIINSLLNKTGADKYVDRGTVQRIQGTATDFLMISGIGSLNITVVMDYAVPLIVVCGLGFLCTWFWFLVVGGKSSESDWFERNMMMWGHATGVAATGVLLQRVVDPDLKSRGIEDSGIADIFNRPFIIGLQVLPPILITSLGTKGSWMVTIVSFVLVIGMWIFAYVTKGWVPGRKLVQYRGKK